jgi:hypothetical protein
MARPKIVPPAAAGAVAVLVSSLVGFTVPAKADCADGIKHVKMYTARERDPERRRALHLLIAKAETARPASETACNNYVARTYRLLRTPPAAAAAGATPPGGLLPQSNEVLWAGRVGSPNLESPFVTTETPPSPSEIEEPTFQIQQPNFQIGQPGGPAIRQSGPTP